MKMIFFFNFVLEFLKFKNIFSILNIKINYHFKVREKGKKKNCKKIPTNMISLIRVFYKF